MLGEIEKQARNYKLSLELRDISSFSIGLSIHSEPASRSEPFYISRGKAHPHIVSVIPELVCDHRLAS